DPWQLTTEQLTAWISNPRWTSETRRSVRSTASVFYRWGLDTGRISVNPAAGLPTVRPRRGAPRPVPDRVLEAALARATDRDRLMIYCAALAGGRRAEIAQLHVDDLLDEGIVWHGKGGATRIVPWHPLLAA